MYKKIVVGLSLEHGVADRALSAAAKLAEHDSQIIAVHVREPIQESVRSYVSADDVAKAKQQVESALAKRLEGREGIEAKVLEGQPGRTLTEFADAVSADCIVVASHKPGLRDYFLGSTAARVVRHAQCSVHVLR